MCGYVYEKVSHEVSSPNSAFVLQWFYAQFVSRMVAQPDRVSCTLFTTCLSLTGKISRVLAAKTALAIRVDALGDTSEATIGYDNRAKVC